MPDVVRLTSVQRGAALRALPEEGRARGGLGRRPRHRRHRPRGEGGSPRAQLRGRLQSRTRDTWRGAGRPRRSRAAGSSTTQGEVVADGARGRYLAAQASAPCSSSASCSGPATSPSPTCSPHAGGGGRGLRVHVVRRLAPHLARGQPLPGRRRGGQPAPDRRPARLQPGDPPPDGDGEHDRDASRQLYDGRAVLGVGRGDSAVRTLGLPPMTVKEFREALRTHSRALPRRRGGLRRHGDPLPVAHAHGPGAGWRRTGPGCSSSPAPRPTALILQLASPSVVEWSVGHARRGREQAGLPWAGFEVLAGAPTYVSDDREHALSRVRGFPATVSNHVKDLLRHHAPSELPADLVEGMDRRRRLRLPAARPARRAPRRAPSPTRWPSGSR